MFWFGKNKKAKKPFDSKTAAKEIKVYIQSKIPVNKAKENLSGEKQQPETGKRNNEEVRYSLPDSGIRYSISRSVAIEQEIKQNKQTINIEDDYKAWEKGHSSRKIFSALILNKIKETSISSREFYSRAGIDR